MQSAVIAESNSVVADMGTGETVSTILTSGPARRRTASMILPMFSTFSATVVVRICSPDRASAVVRACWGMKAKAPSALKKEAATPRVITNTWLDAKPRRSRSRLAGPKASSMARVGPSTGPFSIQSIR